MNDVPMIHVLTLYDLYPCRRGEVTEEYMSGMQPVDNNRFVGNSQSIVLQPISNNTHNQKTKYYDNEVSTAKSQAKFKSFNRSINNRAES